MEKDYVFIKANGIRKELQETNKLLKRIAKAIEKSNKQSDEVSSYNVGNGTSTRWVSDTTLCIDGVKGKDELSGNSSPEDK